jgi:hypothetical protein
VPEPGETDFTVMMLRYDLNTASSENVDPELSRWPEINSAHRGVAIPALPNLGNTAIDGSDGARDLPLFDSSQSTPYPVDADLPQTTLPQGSTYRPQTTFDTRSQREEPNLVYLGEWSAEDRQLMTELDHRWVMKHAANWRTFHDPAIRSRLQRAHNKIKEIIQERADAEERAAVELWQRQRRDRLENERLQRLARKRERLPEWERDPVDDHLQHLRGLQSIQDPMERHRATVEAERAFSGSANNGPDAGANGGS